MNLFAIGMGILILGKTAAELWLACLNQRHVQDRANAVPDASKLLVKVYPGVFSQILEGVEGLIRLPGG